MSVFTSIPARAARFALAALLTLLLLPGAAAADTVFAPADGPGGDALSDAPIEVGMKIRSSQDGFITALRFYKQPNNTGTHVGHLWAADGTQLASATYVDETASGWQEVPLPQPVAINANTTYVVSYYSPQGKFAWSPGFFTSAVGSGALTAPADGASGGNGVYKYGSERGVPVRHLERDELLGRRRLQRRAALGHAAAGGLGHHAGRRRPSTSPAASGRPPRSTSRWTPPRSTGRRSRSRTTSAPRSRRPSPTTARPAARR